MGTTSFLLRSMFSNHSRRPWLSSWNSYKETWCECQDHTGRKHHRKHVSVTVWFCTWHCNSALCSSSLQRSSEVPRQSQREFMSFSASLNSQASSESGADWRKSALLRLMDNTWDLWASIPFCSSWTHKTAQNCLERTAQNTDTVLCFIIHHVHRCVCKTPTLSFLILWWMQCMSVLRASFRSWPSSTSDWISQVLMFCRSEISCCHCCRFCLSRCFSLRDWAWISSQRSITPRTQQLQTVTVIIKAVVFNDNDACPHW